MSDAGAQRWRHGSLLPVPVCPACGSTAASARSWIARDYLGGNADDQWHLRRCAGCASIVLDPRPDDASLPMAYAGYYTHAPASGPTPARGSTGAAWALFNGYLRARFDWRREPCWPAGRWLCAAFPPLARKLDYYGRHLFARRFPQRGLLLDVGCGNGEFLAQARDMGWEVLGVEPDAAAVAAVRAQGLAVVEGGIDAVPARLEGQVDAATLSHCIEHVPDPRGLLRDVHRLLRPGGWIWIATPNPGGPGLRVFGSAWRGLEPSRHLCVPSQPQLQRMLVEAGFEQVQRLRRGEHGKTITRESAVVARLEAARGGSWRWHALALLAIPVRVFASLAGSLFPGWGEESVTVARRPVPSR